MTTRERTFYTVEHVRLKWPMGTHRTMWRAHRGDYREDPSLRDALSPEADLIYVVTAPNARLAVARIRRHARSAVQRAPQVWNPPFPRLSFGNPC